MPLPSPKPPKSSRDPTTLSSLIAVLDRDQTGDAANFGLKNIRTVGEKVVGDISETKSFIDGLRNKHIPRTQLRIRDNAVFINASSSPGELAGDFGAVLK
jgi:hypothetical protein